MPRVLDDEPSTPPVAQPTEVRIAPKEFHSVTVDSRYEPSASLLINVEGSSWIANYFSQILGRDNQVSAQQPALDPVYQQYRLIKNFELKVTSPLTQSQDPQSNAMKLTGAANVYPFLIPNQGDMFIADVGDGREGIFRITEVERRSIFKDTCYAIQYELIAIADADRTKDLYDKVQQTLVFVKDFLQHGQNPMLQLGEYETVKALADRYHDIVQVYFRAVFSSQYKTLCIPGQEYPTYDPYQVKTVLKYFTTWDAEEIRAVRILNVDDDPAMKSYTLWDALTEKNPRHLKLAARQMTLVSARAFTRDPMLEGIFWSGIERVVYPKDPTVNVNFEQIKAPKPPLESTLTGATTQLVNLADLISDRSIDDEPVYGDAPLIHPVLKDDFYVFTEAFYVGAVADMSKLERAVTDYLAGKPVSNALLLQLAETYYAWGALEKYYYLPIVLLLIKYNIRSL